MHQIVGFFLLSVVAAKHFQKIDDMEKKLKNTLTWEENQVSTSIINATDFVADQLTEDLQKIVDEDRQCKKI